MGGGFVNAAGLLAFYELAHPLASETCIGYANLARRKYHWDWWYIGYEYANANAGLSS